MFNGVGNVDAELAEKKIQLPLEVVTLKVASFTDPDSGTLKTKMGIDVKNYTDAEKPTIEDIPENLTTELDADTNMSVSQLLQSTETPILKKSREASIKSLGSKRAMISRVQLNPFGEKSRRTVGNVVFELNTALGKVPSGDAEAKTKLDLVKKALLKEDQTVELKTFATDDVNTKYIDFGSPVVGSISVLNNIVGKRNYYNASTDTMAVINKLTPGSASVAPRTDANAKDSVKEALLGLVDSIAVEGHDISVQPQIDYYKNYDLTDVTLKNEAAYISNINKLKENIDKNSKKYVQNSKGGIETIGSELQKKIKPGMFSSKLGSFFGSKGGKRSRKNKKSKTMKGGRRNKKTRKH